MITAPNLSELPWLRHGFGTRHSDYPVEITTLRQIHSCVVLHVETERGDRIAEGDGLVTHEPGAVVGVRTADCVPVLLADPVNRVVAAVHAGWRGTATRIVPEALARMTHRFGTRPGDVIAAIGPSIGGCCYEVGPVVARQFGTWVPELEQTEVPAKVNLKSVNSLQLTQAGVRNIWVSQNCTYCSLDFFSFRREPDESGRMISFIGLA